MSTIISKATLTDMPEGFWNLNTGLSSAEFPRYSLDYQAMYERHGNVKICVDFLARNMAHLGLHVYTRDADNNRKREREHKAAQLLKNPLPAVNKSSRYKLLEAVLSDMFISGNGYILKLRDTEKNLIGLLRLPYMNVSVKGVLAPSEYKVTYVDGEKPYKPDDIIHFRMYSTNTNTKGMSPLEGLREVLAEEAQNVKYSAQFWANAARIGGVVERPAEAAIWSDDARKRFREEWQSMYAGEANSGKTAILEEGMTFKPITYSPKDTLYIESRKLTREECARAYHIPPPLVGILDRATFCLPAGELVYTEYGPCPIETIKVGDSVYSHTGEGFELKKVVASQETGIDEIFEIKTQNRTIRANAKHPILVRRTVKVPGIPDSNANEKVKAGQSRFYNEYIHEFVPAGELKVGDIIVTANGNIGTGTRKFTNQRMEFYGLFLGDGWLDKKRGHITIARANNAKYMDYYRNVIKNEFTNFGSNGNGKSRNIETQPVKIQEGERYTRFSSIVVAEEMAELGFNETAHTKRIPRWVYKTTREERLALLRGLFDADGSVNKKGQIDYGSCNRLLVEDVRHLCFGLGIAVNNICVQKIRAKLPNGNYSDSEFFSICLSNPIHNQEIGSHDPDDIERLQNGKPWKKGKTYKDAKKITPVSPKECEYSKIVNISIKSAEPVFDLEIEESHNFIASGVVVHNSNISEQHKSLYRDVLGPLCASIEADFNTQYLSEFPDLKDAYVGFNIEEKLQGDFQQQAESFRQAVGTPWMTPNEARSLMNLPKLDDESADRIATPLNMLLPNAVIEPNDGKGFAGCTVHSAPHTEYEQKDLKADDEGEIVEPDFPEIVEAYLEKWQVLLTKTFIRQRDSLLPKAKSFGRFDQLHLLFDRERWNREMTEDFIALTQETAIAFGRAWSEKFCTQFDVEMLSEWMATNGRIAAETLNNKIFEELQAAMATNEPVDAVKRVFELALAVTVAKFAQSRMTGIENKVELEIVVESPVFATKIWRTTSSNPRPSHRAVNGQEVDKKGYFSNGLYRPGDYKASVDEVAGCRCKMVYRKKKK